jgi:hypothetical protein
MISPDLKVSEKYFKELRDLAIPTHTYTQIQFRGSSELIRLMPEICKEKLSEAAYGSRIVLLWEVSFSFTESRYMVQGFHETNGRRKER